MELTDLSQSVVESVLTLCQLCGHRKSSINHIWNVWNQKSYKLKGIEFTIIGFSVAALRTNFFIKELNIMFDGGLSSNYAPSHVFVTHLHTDHIANCPWHFDPGDVTRNTKFFTPIGTGPRLVNFLEASHPYSGHNLLINQASQLGGAYSVTEVDMNARTEIEIKGTKYILESIECHHTVRCIGYGLTSIKKKLKPEYIGLKGNEIKELKLNNVDVTHEVETPFFLYLGDTGKEVLLNNRISKYSNIMIECTFLEDSEIERADLTKHIHWVYLKQYIIDHPSITFILYHFSSRYKREFINDFFVRENLTNVVVWNSN